MPTYRYKTKLAEEASGSDHIILIEAADQTAADAAFAAITVWRNTDVQQTTVVEDAMFAAQNYQCPVLLSGTYVVDLKTQANTEFFTIPALPSGKSGWMITSAMLVMTAITGSITIQCIFQIGWRRVSDNQSGAFSAQTSTMTKVTDGCSFSTTGSSADRPMLIAGDKLRVNINTAVTGPSVAQAQVFVFGVMI